ncbi:hypothetical protein Pfo_002121, partial [Paulownia fortunei]
STLSNKVCPEYSPTPIPIPNLNPTPKLPSLCLRLVMDGEKKKRKMVDADQEENEEEKMEKFFALIKSTREVRERMVTAGENKEKVGGDKPQAAATAAMAMGAWNPTFRLEDFMEAPPPVPPPATEKAAEAGPSTEGEKQESDEKSEKELDLNLSL